VPGEKILQKWGDLTCKKQKKTLKCEVKKIGAAINDYYELLILMRNSKYYIKIPYV